MKKIPKIKLGQHCMNKDIKKHHGIYEYHV